MNTAHQKEIPLVFDCAGSDLVGIVHRPLAPLGVGVVTVIAGGPQYRAGVGRGMVSIARELCDNGIPVMRFDHRGLGDSAGEFLGFEHYREDIQAAVNAFRREVPQIRKVILWGGCDAASGLMIHAWKISGVTSLVLGNPFVSTSVTQSAVLRQHYLSRLGEWSFWRKLLRFEYNLLDYARAGTGKMIARLGGSKTMAAERADHAAGAEPGSYVDSMLNGLRRFEGPVLFLMSGQSLISREFDELVSRDPAWRETCNRPAYKRIDIPDADQTFSTGGSRGRVSQALCAWANQLSDE